MPQTISLIGHRATATVFCSNLILDNDRLIVLLSAYGPSQEVRAFAQILYGFAENCRRNSKIK